MSRDIASEDRTIRLRTQSSSVRFSKRSVMTPAHGERIVFEMLQAALTQPSANADSVSS